MSNVLRSGFPPAPASGRESSPAESHDLVMPITAGGALRSAYPDHWLTACIASILLYFQGNAIASGLRDPPLPSEVAGSCRSGSRWEAHSADADVNRMPEREGKRQPMQQQ